MTTGTNSLKREVGTDLRKMEKLPLGYNKGRKEMKMVGCRLGIDPEITVSVRIQCMINVVVQFSGKAMNCLINCAGINWLCFWKKIKLDT